MADPSRGPKIPAVSLFVLRQSPSGWQTLLLKRAAHKSVPNQWCPIAGGIESGEKAWQTALREAEEEAGLVLNQLYSADLCEQFYEPADDQIVLIPVFVGLIVGDPPIRLNPENSDWAWLSLDEALQRLPFPAQRQNLKWVWESFVERPLPEILRIV